MQQSNSAPHMRPTEFHRCAKMLPPTVKAQSLGKLMCHWQNTCQQPLSSLCQPGDSALIAHSGRLDQARGCRNRLLLHVVASVDSIRMLEQVLCRLLCMKLDTFPGIRKYNIKSLLCKSAHPTPSTPPFPPSPQLTTSP